MQAIVINRSAAEELSSSTGASTNTPERLSADSLLSLVEITGDFDVKDHNHGNHFLACEILSGVAARTYLERRQRCK